MFFRFSHELTESQRRLVRRGERRAAEAARAVRLRDAAIDAMLDAEISLPTIAATTDVPHTSLWRRRRRREEGQP